VDACNLRCLQFGELAELRAKHGLLNEVAPLPEAAHTWPSLVVNPHKDAQPSGSKVGRITNLPEEV
jgi:anaerobic dimethyl sulfoxide reductase subunit B (iron-sulfur subunit)